MARSRYTPEQRQLGVDLYAEHGATGASRLLARDHGLTVRPDTIGMWAVRAGVVAPHNERLRNQVEATRLTWEARRLEMASRLGDLAGKALEQALEVLDEAGARDATVIAGIAIDKAQLLTGQATGRVEHTSKLDTDIDDLVAELAANDPAPVEAGV